MPDVSKYIRSGFFQKFTRSFVVPLGVILVMEALAPSSVSATSDTDVTARFDNVPASHDGSTAFTLKLHFSEEFRLSYRTLRDAAFEVSGGR